MNSHSAVSISLAVREQAAEWLVILQERNVSAETHTHWQRWREAHVDHERAWQHIEAFSRKLHGLSSPLAHATLTAAHALKRRQVIKALALVVFAGGAVAMRPGNNTGGARVINTGERTQFTREAIAAVTSADDATTAWIDNMIVARDMPLQDFLTELGGHRAGRLGCDPQVADFKVTGTRPLADTDNILAVLHHAARA